MKYNFIGATIGSQQVAVERHGRSGSCVDGAPASSADLAWRRLRSGAVMCLACWRSHCSRLLALMWFARRVLIISLGSTPVTRRRFSRLDAQPINIMPSAPPQPVTPYGVFLSLWRCNPCAAAAAITPSPSLLFGSRARLRSILGGAMAGLVDAAMDHDGPGDPCGLIGDGDRRLLGRHAAEQLRDPGVLVRAFLRLAHNGHCAIDE